MVYIPATTSGLLSQTDYNEQPTNTVQPVQPTQQGQPPEQLIGGPPEVATGPTPQDATQPFTPTYDGVAGNQGLAGDIGAGTSYVDQAKSTVAGQLGTLLSTDNPYIAQARARAEEQAAGRGMLGGTIAGRAGEEAAIRAGIEVASQDAGTYAAAQAREQAGDIAQTQTQLEGSITRTLQDAGFQNDRELAAQAIAGNQQAIQLQGQIQRQRDMFQAQQAKELQTMQSDAAYKLKEMGVDAGVADRYAATMGMLTNTALGTTNNILNNLGIGDVTAAMESLKSFLGDTELGRGVYDANFSLV